jgi:type IV pilus assembly protein PilB
MSDETVNPTEEIGSDTAKFAAVEAPAPDQGESTEPEPRRTFSFGQMLIDAGVLSHEQVDAVQQASQRERLPFGQVLVRDGLMVSRDLATLTALHLGLPLVDLRNETIDLDAVGRLPQEISQRYLVLAMRMTDSHLTVAMTDPSDFQTIQDLTTRTGLAIEPVIATPDDIQENIDLSYRAIEREAAQTMAADGDARPTADALRSSQPTEVVQAMLGRAPDERSSAICTRDVK